MASLPAERKEIVELLVDSLEPHLTESQKQDLVCSFVATYGLTPEEVENHLKTLVRKCLTKMTTTKEQEEILIKNQNLGRHISEFLCCVLRFRYEVSRSKGIRSEIEQHITALALMRFAASIPQANTLRTLPFPKPGLVQQHGYPKTFNEFLALVERGEFTVYDLQAATVGLTEFVFYYFQKQEKEPNREDIVRRQALCSTLVARQSHGCPSSMVLRFDSKQHLDQEATADELLSSSEASGSGSESSETSESPTSPASSKERRKRRRTRSRE